MSVLRGEKEEEESKTSIEVCVWVFAGNHEYDYRTGKEKHKSHSKDPSGAGSPYDPDWGNYGTVSSRAVTTTTQTRCNPICMEAVPLFIAQIVGLH